MQRQHTVRMSPENTNTLRLRKSIIPNAQRPIHTRRNQFPRIELQCRNSPRVTTESLQRFKGLEIPQSDSTVVGSRGEHIIRGLQTHYPVGMSAEDFNRVTTVTPILFDFAAFRVDCFPGPTGLCRG